jgi:hypothetical protein
VVGGEFQEMRFFSFFEEKDNEREREIFMVDGGERSSVFKQGNEIPVLTIFL